MCWHVDPNVLACWSWYVGMLVMACWFVDPGLFQLDEEYVDLLVPCLPDSSLKTLPLQFECYLVLFSSNYGQFSSNFGVI